MISSGKGHSGIPLRIQILSKYFLPGRAGHGGLAGPAGGDASNGANVWGTANSKDSVDGRNVQNALDLLNIRATQNLQHFVDARGAQNVCTPLNDQGAESIPNSRNARSKMVPRVPDVHTMPAI